MTNPLFHHLAPGPQRDEAEAESQMATARETIVRLERELAEMRDAIEAAHQSTRREREIGQQLAREWQVEANRLIKMLARAQAPVVAAAPMPPIRVDCSGMSHDEVRVMLAKRPAQPSGNPGDFAALAERIAYADGKHPRDLPDGGRTSVSSAEARLARERRELAEDPTWANAFDCEAAEAGLELARGDMPRFAEELRDVATVAMRWRRAVMERGKE